MWLVVAVVALVLGNGLRARGIRAARDNPYGSAASIAGLRTSGIGLWINIVGSACLMAAVWTLV